MYLIYPRCYLRQGKAGSIWVCAVPIFPLCFSWKLEEEHWKIESRKHQERLQIVLKDKTKHTRILCVHARECVCVFDLLIFRRGKSVLFLTCLLESAFAFVQIHSFLILSMQKFPSVYASQTLPFDHISLVGVPLSNGVSLFLKRL